MGKRVRGGSGAHWAAPFLIIWTGQAFSLVGSMLVQFSLIWWLTTTTGSATILASATLVALFPTIVLGPFAGALVDRWNRRLIMIAADGAIALASAWLAYLFWSRQMQIAHVYVVMLIRSLGDSFHWPAMEASTSLMVPRAQLSRVAGMNETLEGALNIVSPPLGALLIAWLPLHGIIALDLLTALPAILPLLFLAIPQPPRQAASPTSRASLWREVGEGLRYVHRWPGLFTLVNMLVVSSLFLIPALSLTPLLVTRHFQGRALELGWMESANGAGVLLGGLLLSVWGGFRRRILTAFTGIAGMGVGVLLIGLAPREAFWLALSGMGLLGLMIPISNGPIHAVLQSTVPPEMQGRIMTIVVSAVRIASPLGLALAGPVADALGLQVWYLAAGSLALLMGSAAFFVPVLVHLEDQNTTGLLASKPVLESSPVKTVTE